MAGAVAFTQNVATPLCGIRYDAHAVLHLVHDGACALIAGVGAHVHPRLVVIVAIGSRRAGTVADIELLPDAGQVVENLAGFGSGIVDAFVGVGIATVVVPVGDIALGYGAELDDLAVARQSVLVGGIGTHIIHGGGLQVLKVIDDAVV